MLDTGANPFRLVVFDFAWRTETAAVVALQIHEPSDFSALPVLADTIEDAGFDDPAPSPMLRPRLARPRALE